METGILILMHTKAKGKSLKRKTLPNGDAKDRSGHQQNLFPQIKAASKIKARSLIMAGEVVAMNK